MARSNHWGKRILVTVWMLLAVLSVTLFFGCGKEQSPGNGALGNSLGNTQNSANSAAEISEAAINRFMEKVAENNYVIDCSTYLKGTVVSEDLVLFEYVYQFSHNDVMYDGFTVMTVNDNETFLGFLGEDGVDDLSFINEGKAVDLAANTSAVQYSTMLLSDLIASAGGNIWDLFYNDVEEPLRFERLKEEDVYYKHSTPEGQKAFIYHFSEDGETLQMLFKSETFVPSQEMTDDLNAAGFPVPDMAACASARDFRRFQKTMYGREYPLDYSVSFDFETAAQAAAFLENYIHILQDENDFDITNPQAAEINKNRTYVKEDGKNRLIFGMDYAEGSVTVNVEFRLTENAAE